MTRLLFALLVVVHGFIHLMGFAKGWRFAELPQLTQAISKPLALLWLLAAMLLFATAAALYLWPRWWWAVGAVALAVSQVVIITAWTDARYGTVANVILLIGVGFGFLSQGPSSFRAEYAGAVERLLKPVADTAVITDADLAHLPEVVRKYLRTAARSGSHESITSGPGFAGRFGADRPPDGGTAQISRVVGHHAGKGGLHFIRLLDGGSSAAAGFVGGAVAILGALMLAADKGALCLTMSALDTLPDGDFARMMPGLRAMFAKEGWLVLLWGILLLAVGFAIQAVALLRTNAIPRWQSALFLVGVLLVATPDGVEIVNLTASILLAIAFVPYGVQLLWRVG